MRHLKTILLFSVCLSISCSKDCENTCDLEGIVIFNYNIKDIDNIVIKGYKNDSTFQTLLDSFKIVKLGDQDSNSYYNYCYLDKSLKIDYDYDIYFSDFNSHCKITRIKTIKEECQDGLFSNDYSYIFDGYYVDDLLFACQVLKAHP